MKSNYAKATKVLGIAFLFLIQTNVWAQLRTNAVQDASSITMEQAKNSNTQQANNQVFENSSPFDAVKGLREDLSKRDAFSKHYINEDGSFTALIGAGPIHYERNGQFLDIDHTITQSSTMNFPFANTTNLMESYFGATVEYGVKSKTMEGEVVEFMNPTMYWEVNGQAMGTQQAANTQVQIQADKATYPNIYGDISAEYKVLTGKREMNYIIPNPQALGAVPAGADYLVFTEDVVLPFGWTSSLTETGIMIKDAMGQEIYLYENPHSTDAESHALREENTIFETLQIGNTLTIKTKVKTEWLLSNERVFPVMVDPTTNVNYTFIRCIYDDGEEQTGGTFYFGRVSGYWLRAHVKYNGSTIPLGSTVNSVRSYVNLLNIHGTYNSANAFRMRNSLDPQTNTGDTLYNSANTNYSINKSITTLGVNWVDLNAAGITAVQGMVGGNINLTIDPAGSYVTTNYYSISNPYLSITYTAPTGPPSCATNPTPSNGSTGAAHQGNLKWNAVAGATSYDVYFGTVASPPLVSTSQTGTTYNVGDCLLPNTQYYWRIVPKNANGSATGCTTWSFTTDSKLNIYQIDWENADIGVFNTAGGVDTDGWLTNNNSATGGIWSSGYNNTWTVGEGPHAISGKSVGVSALYNGGLGGQFFQYWSDLGEIHRWIYRPFDMRGLRDIEVSFKWKAGGEANQDYGSVISSINGGATWLMDEQGGLYNDGKYWNSPNTIQEQTVLFPESRNNQQNFVLGFKWDDLSGNGVSGDPSFVVDDIIVKACPFEGEILSDEVGPGIYEWVPAGSTETTLTIDGSHPCAQYEWEQSIDEGVTWTVITGANTDSYTTPNDLTVSTWYRSRVYFGTGCPGVYQEEPFKVIIEKCESTTVWTSSGWSPSVPTVNTTKIVFEADYNSGTDTHYPVSGGLIGCSVEVKEDVDVVIAAAHSITIDNEIKVADTGSFTLKDGANLVQINDDAVNSGNITAEKGFTFSTDRNQYNFVISPVVGQNIKELFENNNYKAQWYNEETNYFVFFDGDYNEIANIGGAGIGQAIQENQEDGNVQTATYYGEPHNGVITVSNLTNGNTRFHLAGNPYPSHIDLVEFYNDNQNNIEPRFLFWDNRGNEDIYQQGDDYHGDHYAQFNAQHETGVAAQGETVTGPERVPTKDVAVGNAFMLRLLEAPVSKSYSFKNSQRTAGEGENFLGRNYSTDGIVSSEMDRYWLTLNTPGGISVMNAVVYYDGGNDDFGLDDNKIMGGSDDIYTLVDEHQLKIQGKSSFDVNDKIKLGYKAYAAGVHTISIYDKEGVFADGQKIFIRDFQTGIVHELTQSDFTFKTFAGEFNDRFEIFYKRSIKASENKASLSNVVIYQNENHIQIAAENQLLSDVEIYDLNGISVYQATDINLENWQVPNHLFGKGILVVVVKTADGEVVNKKLINK